MEITYDHEADALSITFKKGSVAKTIKIAHEVILDIDENGKPLYLEIIGASEKIGKRRVSEVLMKNFIPAVPVRN